VYELFVSLAAHTLAISGYHQAWALQAVAQERRRLRSQIHSKIKGFSETIRIDLENVLALLDDVSKFHALQPMLERAYALSQDVASQAGHLLDLMDVSDWRILHSIGLPDLLAEYAARLVGNDELFVFRSDYPDGHPLPIFHEVDMLEFGLEAVLNSVRHAQGKPVTVQLHLEDACARLTVQDGGPGIPEAKLAALLQTNGFRTLHEAAAGRAYTVHNRPEGGLEVVMTVPRMVTDGA
jgi:signal transduction histidine kinase